MTQQIGVIYPSVNVALCDYMARNGKDQPYLVADLDALRTQPDHLFHRV